MQLGAKGEAETENDIHQFITALCAHIKFRLMINDYAMIKQFNKYCHQYYV